MLAAAYAILSSASVACEQGDGLHAYPFTQSDRQPRQLSQDEVRAAVLSHLRPRETVAFAQHIQASGHGHTVIQAILRDGDLSRAIVIDEDGNAQPTQDFWAHERERRVARFGKLEPDLFEHQAALSSFEVLDVDVFIRVNAHEPHLPRISNDKLTPIEEFEQWSHEHALAQVARIAAAKTTVRELLDSHGAVILADPSGLPTITARVPVQLLRSAELNSNNVMRVSMTSSRVPELLGYAGRAAMASSPAAGGLSGGICGGPCSGGGIDVGIWEGIETPPFMSGIARNNSRVSTGNVLTGYMHCPKQCNTDADCPDLTFLDTSLRRRCRATTTNGPKTCVQDHLTWVAASLGMYGSYAYTSTVPITSDPNPNVPAGTTFGSTGVWDADIRVGNDSTTNGLSFLVTAGPSTPPACQQPNAPPAVYVNRSQAGTPAASNWVGRYYGTFLTSASGNRADMSVECATLKNGLCVGMFDYSVYSNQDSHLRTSNSSYINNQNDVSLERPHLLGPGNHSGNGSGLHMPSIDVDPASSQMRHASYDGGVPAAGISGTSFAAPAVLSAAIQAHQYEGWFSALAYPMVNKAILLAATRDANNDGAVGKTSTWAQNAPNVDAEDGAGQINLAALKYILDNNSYFWADLKDSDFISCGTGCREYTVSTVTVPGYSSLRASLAWQACMIDESSLPTINNDLDLLVSCGSPIFGCGAAISDTVSSELEMVQKACTTQTSCSIRIRIKNGAALQACGSTATERVGVAWRMISNGAQ